MMYTVALHFKYYSFYTIIHSVTLLCYLCIISYTYIYLHIVINYNTPLSKHTHSHARTHTHALSHLDTHSYSCTYTCRNIQPLIVIKIMIIKMCYRRYLKRDCRSVFFVLISLIMFRYHCLCCLRIYLFNDTYYVL